MVADEVRQLAQRVSQATTEIASLIDNVQVGVDESVKATETGSEQVVQGTELADKAGIALQEIITAVAEVSGKILEISTAAGEVSASSAEMVSHIDDVDVIATQNATTASTMGEGADKARESMNSVAAITEEASATAEESSALTEELSAQVEELVASAQSL